MICNYYSTIKAKFPFSQTLIKKIISLIAQELKLKKNFEITVLLVGDKKIRVLNKKYRQKDKITDVLAFSPKEGKQFIVPEAVNYLGEIFICYPQLKRQAKKFGQTIEKEFALLLIHGFLHLVGYDDQKVKDYQLMKQMQDKIFFKIYGKG